MGYNLYTFIGPYISVNETVAYRTKKVHACTNKSCSRATNERFWHTSDNFCGACGTKIQETEVRVPGTLGVLSVLDTEGFVDFLHKMKPDEDTKVSYLGPNRPNKNWDFYPKENSSVTEITPELIKAQVEWFKEEYAKPISCLEKAFGALEVKWGVICYYA